VSTSGYVRSAEKTGMFDGIYLGHRDEKELVYAGKLERGFSEGDKRAILKRLLPLRVRSKPVASKRKSFPKAPWVKPTATAR
jgi:ATP-dependent DNA ligase